MIHQKMLQVSEYPGYAWVLIYFENFGVYINHRYNFIKFVRFELFKQQFQKFTTVRLRTQLKNKFKPPYSVQNTYVFAMNKLLFNVNIQLI